MATANNFSKAVKGFMGMPAAEEAIGSEKPETDEAEDFTRAGHSEPEVEMESEKKNFLFTAKNMAESAVKSFKPENSMTTISKTMVITGEIVSSGDIDVFGDIHGTVKTTGDLKITGKILGDLAGNNFMLTGCIIQGNIVARGNVIVGTETTIVGDIVADSIRINGKVKGNLTIDKMSEFLENALLVGDVNSKTISMAQGSKLHGNVSIASDSAQSEKEFDAILGL